MATHTANVAIVTGMASNVYHRTVLSAIVDLDRIAIFLKEFATTAMIADAPPPPADLPGFARPRRGVALVNL